jgi:Kef-type K+ transport system membrane component KefB
MFPLEAPQFFGILAVILATAKIFGALARKLGQPAVLGELVAGVIVGTSVLGFVDPKNEVFHLLAEVGVVILLFEIGLETDLHKLLQVGMTSTIVALAGVALPFVLGYALCKLLGLETIVAIVVGASLTATSVGITARVFAELGRLHDPESQIVLGAAVIDDVIGLVILTVVSGLSGGQSVTVLEVMKITGLAFGFLAAVLVFGRLLIPLLGRWMNRAGMTEASVTTFAVIMALGMAWLASTAGSATIIGAFAIGLLLGKVPQVEGIQRGVAYLGHFFVPIFFVMVGAAVELRVLNPLNPHNFPTLLLGGLLILVAVAGKFFAGYAPFWYRGNKKIIGVGMIPRGEVGLIFNDVGLRSGVYDAAVYSAVTLMVMVTTFIVPPLLKFLFGRAICPQEMRESPGAEQLTVDA